MLPKTPSKLSKMAWPRGVKFSRLTSESPKMALLCAVMTKIASDLPEIAAK